MESYVNVENDVALSDNILVFGGPHSSVLLTTL